MMKEFVFYYDVVCPYAYLASTQVEEIAQRNNSKIIYKPVLLGGIYKETKAPQGKDGSASDVMVPQKKSFFSRDLEIQFKRRNVPLNKPKKWPLKSLKAQRLLVGVSDETKPKLTNKLYHALWVEGQDLEDLPTLSLIAESFGINNTEEIINDPTVKTILEENTNEVSKRGAIGVPAFWVNNSLIWGSDRLHFVEFELGKKNVEQFRCQKQPKLTFYFDFASPYSYLAWTQLERIRKETNAEIEFVPILVGALFKKIVKAAWSDDVPIGVENYLVEVLNKSGFDGKLLLEKSKEQEIKKKLFGNVDRAYNAGVFGVPSFQVNGQDVVFGQDRLDVVSDQLCGWISKL